MRFMTFHKGQATALGVVDGDTVIDLSVVQGAAVPNDMLSLIEGGDETLAAARSAHARAQASARLPLAGVRPALPLRRPRKFVCVGLNYAEHAKEGGHPIPTYPSFFLRVDTSLIPAGAPIVRPQCSAQLDYECELTVVIGKPGRHISEAQALAHVFGYTLFNDVSVRDYQRKTSQWTAGKNFDGTGPLGPHIVTADELPPGASGLRIATRVNGRTMQESNTADMIFSVARTISILSEIMTLEPGDMIATGTPSGVAHARKPPAWMVPGDTVEVEVERIGVLRNSVVAEASHGGATD